MKICLVQYSPFYPKVGMLDSYNEVVESYAWGFVSLGHEVIHRINCCCPESLNIVFGWQIPFSLGLIDSFPADTILFNFERYTGYEPTSKIMASIAYVANKYQFWDYSQQNVAKINALNPRFPAYYARISYAPNLEKLPTNLDQDIDVLYYGNLVEPYRYNTLAEIAKTHPDLSGLKTMTLSHIWGKQRDEFIARAKLIVNISPGGDIFEIVRVSYLLANQKAVVCATATDIEFEDLEDDLNGGVLKFTNNSNVHAVCQDLVEDSVARAEYAKLGYDTFRQRDIREVIKNFFG